MTDASEDVPSPPESTTNQVCLEAESNDAQNRWTKAEPSDWGLFNRSTSVVRQEGESDGARLAYKNYRYTCSGKVVEFKKPLQGAGTALMHGDFARKLSPSEEALATFILKHPKLFDGKRVLDVGAGLGFAGLACAVCTEATVVELTDGDPVVVDTLRASAKLNEQSFGTTEVVVRRCLWDKIEDWPEKGSFDIVIAADVVYLDFLHSTLLSMVSKSLRHGGQFLLFASRRNGSLERFVGTAKHAFQSVHMSDDYDADVAKAIGRSTKCFPVMVRLYPGCLEAPELPSNVAKICEEMREQRSKETKRMAKEARCREKSEENHRFVTEMLLEQRKRRLEEQKDREAEEHAASEAAAASAAEPAHSSAPSRQSAVPTPEPDGMSDWGLFPRECHTSDDMTGCKLLTYDCRGQSVTIRKPLHGDFFHGDFARKLSPAEEVLALHILKRHRQFKKRRVLILGAGIGLAGVVAATCTSAKHVEVTDGDVNAVEIIRENLALNSTSFRAKKVSSRRLLWGESAEAMKPFDWILAADVVYHADSHMQLLGTMKRLLKPSGTVLLFAPPRNGSLEQFVITAGAHFDHIETTRDYDPDVARAMHGMKCFPQMVRMQRSNIRWALTSAPPLAIVSATKKIARLPSKDLAVDATAALATGDTCAAPSKDDGDVPSLRKAALRRKVLAERWRQKVAARQMSKEAPMQGLQSDHRDVDNLLGGTAELAGPPLRSSSLGAEGRDKAPALPTTISSLVRSLPSCGAAQAKEELPVVLAPPAAAARGHRPLRSGSLGTAGRHGNSSFPSWCGSGAGFNGHQPPVLELSALGGSVVPISFRPPPPGLPPKPSASSAAGKVSVWRTAEPRLGGQDNAKAAPVGALACALDCAAVV
mmetsp:Transcript_35706/g.65525  ORF Transcript_35706/g.65525 Transcript_35706/m.65525 type:complete len:877 (+) Transcript_35706:35-2665(+)